MNILKNSILLSFTSFLTISHAECMKGDNYQLEDNKKRSLSFNKEDENNKKLKMSNSDISLDESSEELISKPILSLDEKYKSESIQTIAKYLLFKEAQNFKNILEGQSIDRLKLQKMLHYSQSYFYALYGKSLFDENMIVYDHGCYSKTLKEWDVYNNTCTNISPLVNDKNVNEFIDLFSPKKLNVTSETKEVIDIVYDLFSKNSGMELRDKNHKEELYIRLWENGMGKGKTIPLDELKFYRQPSELNDFQKVMIVNSIKNEKIDKINKNINWIINTSSIEEIFSKLQNIQERIEHIKEKPEMFLEQWPGQSYSEAVLSTSLFPQNLRDNDELLTPLLLRKKTPIILAFLSKLNNPEAKYYFGEFLDLIFSDSEAKKFRKTYKSIYKFKNKIKEDANEQLEKISQQDSSDFYKGMSLLYLNKKNEALQIFKEITKENVFNPWALYKRASLEKEINSKEECWHKAEELLNKNNTYSSEEKLVLTRLYLDKGRYAEPLEEGLSSYICACELGLPSGYLSIGRILNEEIGKKLTQLDKFKTFAEKNNIKTSHQFFEKAGEEGVLTGYELAAVYEIKQNNKEKAKELYMQQGDKGDPEGYFNLARLYEEEDKIEEAVHYYKKSGFLIGGREQAARLLNQEGNSNEQKENFVQKLKLLLEETDEE